MTRARSSGIGLAACVVIMAATAAAGQRSPVVTRPEGLARQAAQWVDAMLTHRTGTADRATATIATWRAGDFDDLIVELGVIVRLMRDEKATYFPFPTTFDPGIPRQIRYSTAELDTLREAAATAVHQGLTGPDLLARGIVLHSDLALAGGGAGTVLHFADGQQIGLERGRADHWQVARSLVGLIAPRTDRDVDLRRWYRATALIMASIDNWNVAHLDDALARFPDDAELQFLAGCLHETLAAPRTQAVIPDSDLPDGMVIRVRSERDELKLAAARLERALALNRRHTEARIHYGRVLTLMDRASNAVTELQRAASEATDPAPQYYARLFLGSALEAANRRDEARAAYEQAAGRFPRAQAPRLALSALAASTGDRGVALDALAPMLAVTEHDADEDPWWNYFVSYTGQAKPLMTQALRQLATPHQGVAP